MKRRIFLVLLSLVCVVCLAFGITACNKGTSGTNGGQNTEQTGSNTDDVSGSTDDGGSTSGGNTDDGSTGGEATHTHAEAEAVIENEIAATCTESGSYDSVIYCSTCGEELSREAVTVEATGHTEAEAVKENEIAATCTESGSYDSVIYCSVCGEELSREAVTVEATGHTEAEAVKENEIAATCTESGSYDSVIYCSVCGTELSRETVTVPASSTGHVWDGGEVITAPTCTESGSAVYTCTICGETKTDEVAALGHDYVSEVTIEPTYTTMGLNTYTCSRCGDSYTKEIAVLGHTHEYESSVTKEATCTEDGVKTYVCSLCDDTYTEVIPAKGHTRGTAVKENEIAATCTNTGSYDTVIYCTVCGEELSRQTTAIPATGHNSGTSVKENEVAATCTKEGSYDTVVYCTVCGAEISRETVTIPKTAHNYQSTVTAPTCTAQGYTTYTCTVCGDSYKSDYVNATGHNYSGYSYDGNSHWQVCIVCGAKTASASHTMSNGVCTVCGYAETLAYSLSSDGKYYTVNGIGSVSSSTVTIPETYNGLPVKAIASNAFSGNVIIVIIIISGNVTTIGANAFSGCTALKQVTIGSGVTSIGDSAFSGCSNLSSVSLGDNVQTIGANAFENCVSITVIIIGSGVILIGDSAFSGCSNLTSLTIGSNVQSIGSGAFSNCSSLTQVSIPASVTAVGSNAFANCVKIVIIIILGNPEIGDGAFSGCVLVTDLTLSDELLEKLYDIISKAFPDSSALTDVKEADSSATYHAHALEHIERVEATCTQSGNTEYWYCSTCGKYFSDSRGSDEISSEDTVISVAGHTSGAAVKENEAAATCISAGSYDLVVYCTVCGGELSRETVLVPVTEHSWDVGVIVTEPTCIETGVVKYVCEVCGAVKTEELAMTDHTAGEAVAENYVAATCTQSGSYDAVIKCSVCGEELSREAVIIEATGHNFVNNVCTECGFVGLILNGRVYKADSDSDTTNNTPLSGITINLTDSSGNLYSTTTNSSGEYEINGLVEDDYILTVSEDGYITLEQQLHLSLSTTQNVNLMVVEGDESQSGNVSGYAKDSTSASGISGLTVYVRSGINNTTGTVVATAATTSGGYYVINGLTIGNYTLEFVDERTTLTDESYRYTTGTISVAVISNSTVANQNIVLNNSATVTATSLRIVLTWGSTPSDLDSHLITSTGSHIYYSNKTYSWGSLDVDDTSSYGPETITVSTLQDGVTYTYYVYNFSGGSSTALANSGATVNVYSGSELLYTFYVPSGSGRYWTLFSYNSETGFTIINAITTSAPSA